MTLLTASLLEPHRAFPGRPGGVSWWLTEEGVVVDDDLAPRGSGGRPVTIGRIWERYRTEIMAAAVATGVPVELLLATIATESRGNPVAERAEPGFISYDRTPHRVSIGLTQTLLSTARMALGDAAITEDDLRDPACSLRAGAAYMKLQAAQTGYDPPKVACAYNAGGIYYQGSAGNRWKMRQFPIGTGAHADRFVAWFNDCFMLDLELSIAPGFARDWAAFRPVPEA